MRNVRLSKKRRKKLSTITLILGFLFLSIFSWELYIRNRPARLAFASTPDVEQTVIKEDKTPVVLKIERLSIELPIIPASFEGQKWPTTQKGVSYLTSSSLPGEGNTVIYGHNWPNLLGGVYKIQPGDTITLITMDGTDYSYTVAFTQVVDPTQTYILNNTNDNRLTLYTCTGFLDTKRFVITGLL